MKQSASTPLDRKSHGFKVEKPSLLMDFLQLKYPEKSRNSIKSLLTHKQIFVDGLPVSQYNFHLNVGHVVTIEKSTKPEAGSKTDFTILFEDDHIVVVDKRAGILSIATDTEREHTVYNMLSDHVKESSSEAKIYVVHRLDRETSGVMVYAKSQEAKFALQQNWDSSVVQRTYIALVEGVVKNDSETLVSNLWEDKNYLMHSTPNRNIGQEAITKYKVLRRSKGFSLLEVELETGRKNQIRVHMQMIGYPVVGDKKYGAKTNPIRRGGLHANVLSFKHPITNNIISFESPIPAKFTALFGAKQ